MTTINAKHPPGQGIESNSLYAAGYAAGRYGMKFNSGAYACRSVYRLGVDAGMVAYERATGKRDYGASPVCVYDYHNGMLQYTCIRLAGNRASALMVAAVEYPGKCGIESESMDFMPSNESPEWSVLTAPTAAERDPVTGDIIR